uniref:Uncharacterized protein n=1 Tax=Peronospora matthiolae TaxID=2874970 RepID=A0AAV1UWC8_9STRA
MTYLRCRAGPGILCSRSFGDQPLFYAPRRRSCECRCKSGLQQDQSNDRATERSLARELLTDPWVGRGGRGGEPSRIFLQRRKKRHHQPLPQLRASEQARLLPLPATGFSRRPSETVFLDVTSRRTAALGLVQCSELVRSVDVLLRELVPDDKLDAAFESLSIAASSGAALVEAKAHDASIKAGTAAVDANEPDFEGAPPVDEESSDEESTTEKTVPGELERKWAKIRAVFHDWDEEHGDREKKMDDMAELLLRYRVLEKVLMPKVLGQLTFETRKYVGHVFRAMTVHNLRGFIELIGERPDIMRWLVEGYKNNDTALICGSMLRDCFEHQTLTMIFLQTLAPEFEFLFKVTMENSNFDISADALINISRLLTVHKKVTVQLLDEAFDHIFGLLNGLLTSENYATRRQALQLLSELLLDPVNFSVMQRYVASRTYLKQVMLLLREPSEALRMDAFHVFKIFVANPNKSPEVEQLLVRNREKLLAFVSDFGKSASNRDFLQERSLLVFALERMAQQTTAQEKGQEQATRPASLSNAERQPLSGSVSQVCANRKRAHLGATFGAHHARTCLEFLLLFFPHGVVQSKSRDEERHAGWSTDPFGVPTVQFPPAEAHTTFSRSLAFVKRCS